MAFRACTHSVRDVSAQRIAEQRHRHHLASHVAECRNLTTQRLAKKKGIWQPFLRPAPEEAGETARPYIQYGPMA